MQEQIPYSLIGALALSLYGLPRFTADIDLLTKGRFWPQISPIMKKLGYTCYQKTASFAQFDSEMGVLGKIDFMSQKNLAKGKRPKDTLMRYLVLLIGRGILDYDKESTVYQGRKKKDPGND